MSSLTPAEAAALLAIHAGARDEKEVASMLNTDVETARRLVERLRSRGLVEVEERRILFIRRRRLRLTEKGLEAIPEARRVLLETVAARSARSEARHETQGAEKAPSDAAMAPELGLPLLALLPLLLGAGLVGAALAAGAALIEEADGGEDHGDEQSGIIQYDPEEWV